MSARVVSIVVAAGVMLAALVVVVTDAAMASSSGEPAALYRVFIASFVGAGAVGWWLTRVHRRLPSLRWTILVVASAAVVVATVVVAASTSAMFLAAAELRLVLAALLLGAGLGVMVAVSVTGPLTTDLRALADAARRVADGDLTVRTDIARSDEVGEVAASLDRMVAQLARLEEQRVRGEAARRRLLTSIGHDLRTPLASMQAAIEALEDGVAPDTDRYLRSMGNDVELLRRMVGDLFVLAQLEAGELHLDRLAIDLAELVDGAAEAVSALAAKRGIEVRTDLAGSVPTSADPQALDRVLRNLLDNAIRHAPAGSSVEVSVTVEGATAAVRVHDAGEGFPPGFVERAFDRFSRADVARERRGGGAGLGLAIAKELIEAHDGDIWIEPGAGATVAFRLPIRLRDPHANDPHADDPRADDPRADDPPQARAGPQARGSV